jgi:hypothetical protein
MMILGYQGLITASPHGERPRWGCRISELFPLLAGIGEMRGRGFA